ncbi:unnamed protein product [Candidula unifasciata]|uniref:Uncharacterized protein n=1 Tax=Candidula unifasciata TaxID=100452 RepID=A0A8S3YNQ7_9EUPU|nr:unnamed protein product [Candidula unifasciata]
MENFPSALVIASYDSVCDNNNVLYRLVRPLPGGIGVQSTDRLVNVVPFRRKYTFEKKQQLEDFGQQMLRRPLVLQPILHFGRGLGYNCAVCYQDELWLVMVNQTHPKILSRLQMGLDSAKAALARGQPFEIRFRFGKLIQRVYTEHLAQKEKGEAQNSGSACLTYFRYAEWEHCDLNLRYHGYGANINRSSAFHSLPSLEMKWDFEDIGMHEMEWNQLTGEVYPRPHLSSVYEDEIREALPGWTINSVSPLENIGDSVPENNYDYAQAGRLYASFRKKSRLRNIPQHGAVSGSSAYANDYENEQKIRGELEGAVGFDPSVYPDFVVPAQDSSEYDHGYEDTDGYDVPKQTYADSNRQHDGTDFHYQNIHPHDYDDQYSDSRSETQPESNHGYRQSHSSNQAQSTLSASQPDKYGHINANVKVVSNTPAHQYQNYAARAAGNNYGSHRDDKRPASSEYLPYTDPFEKQDSDRFSRSTTADSGYCPDGDDIHSRNGSYDCNDQSNTPKFMKNGADYENVLIKKYAHEDDGGLHNPAFRNDDPDVRSGWQSQKQPMSKVMRVPLAEHKSMTVGSSLSGNSSKFSNRQPRQNLAPSLKESVDILKVPPRRKKAAPDPTGVPQVAESFI